MEQRTIFFNEELHRYTDQFENVYTSTTTLIGKYEEKFDVDKMARVCYKSGLKGNPKYKGKSVAQLKQEWADETKRACEKGTVKHDFLEHAIKNSNNYHKIITGGNMFINDRLFTLDNIFLDSRIGQVNVEYFVKCGIYDKYPTIYNVIANAVDRGYKIYSEIGVYSSTYVVSGLIDILILNPETKEFIILDWKTNKAPLMFESGYFKKNDKGLLTDIFINDGKYFKYPLNRLEQSTGNKYTLQLSMYDYLAEGFGYTCKGNILCHIRDIVDNDGKKIGEDVSFHTIPYLRNDIHNLLEHHAAQNIVKNQYTALL